MIENQKSKFQLKKLIILALVFIVSACASVQSPTGGPRDKEPPKVVKESPKNFTTNFKSREVNIDFDEYFKLNNEYKEVSMSPAPDKAPQLKIRKKTLNIKFQDTLEANTTYTINFGNGIADFNEGNVLKNYVYVFSTGQKIDSLSISGKITDALTKKPVLDATVFLLPLKQDTLFGKKRASIFTSTDSAGNFKLKYLRNDKYKIYAVLEEGGGDKIYNSANEYIGFKKEAINLTKDTTEVSMELFKQVPASFRVIDRKIENTGRILYIFNKKLEKPGLKILEPATLDARKIVEFAATGDTAFVWSPDLTFDSITVAIQNANKNIDTTTIRRNKRDEYNKPLTITDNLSGGRIKPGTDLILTFSSPITAINPKSISLMQDSIPVNGLRIEKDTLSTRRYVFKYPWKKERQYILNIAENGITGLNGNTNKPYTLQLSRDLEENYGNLTMNFSVPDTARMYVIEFLNKENQVLQRNPLSKNTVINYVMFPVGKYTFRVIYDDNRNGKWDTGDVKEGLQPEKIWVNPTEFTLRANWDLEEKTAIPPPK